MTHYGFLSKPCIRAVFFSMALSHHSRRSICRCNRCPCAWVNPFFSIIDSLVSRLWRSKAVYPTQDIQVATRAKHTPTKNLDKSIFLSLLNHCLIYYITIMSEEAGPTSQAVSHCCSSYVYTDFTGPQILEQLREEGLLDMTTVKVFSDVDFCSICRKPCQVTYLLS